MNIASCRSAFSLSDESLNSKTAKPRFTMETPSFPVTKESGTTLLLFFIGLGEPYIPPMEVFLFVVGLGEPANPPIEVFLFVVGLGKPANPPIDVFLFVLSLDAEAVLPSNEDPLLGFAATAGADRLLVLQVPQYDALSQTSSGMGTVLKLSSRDCGR